MGIGNTVFPYNKGDHCIEAAADCPCHSCHSLCYRIPDGKEDTVFPYYKSEDCIEAAADCPLSFIDLVSLQQVPDL